MSEPPIKIPPLPVDGKKPDSDTKKAANDLDEPGWLGKLLGTGDLTRLPLAAVIGVVCLGAYLLLTVHYSNDARVDQALSLLDKSIFLMIGVIAGSSNRKKD